MELSHANLELSSQSGWCRPTGRKPVGEFRVLGVRRSLDALCVADQVLYLVLAPQPCPIKARLKRGADVPLRRSERARVCAIRPIRGPKPAHSAPHAAAAPPRPTSRPPAAARPPRRPTSTTQRRNCNLQKPSSARERACSLARDDTTRARVIRTRQLITVAKHIPMPERLAPCLHAPQLSRPGFEDGRRGTGRSC